MRVGVVASLVVVGVLGCKPKPVETLYEEVPVLEDESGEVEVAEAKEETPPYPVVSRVNEAAALLTTRQSRATNKAVEILMEVLDAAPTTAEAYFNLGVAHQILDQKDKALAAYSKASGLDPSLGSAQLYAGGLRQSDGDLAGAIRAYQSGVSGDPENMELRVALIGALRTQGNVEEAIEAAKGGLRVNANSLAIYNSLGLAYLDTGQNELAKFVYQKALNSIEGAANNAYIHANLGRTYYLEDDRGPAQYHLEKAYELDPQLVPGLIYLSNLYLDDRNYEQSVPLLEIALKKAPRNFGARMNLGIAYRGVGRLEDSRQSYQEALKIEPGNPDVWFNLGILLGDHLKDYDESLKAFQRYLDAGGSQQELAGTYMKKIEKERSRADKKRKSEEERKQRDAERTERQRVLKEAEQKKTLEANPWGGDSSEEPQPDGSDTSSQPAPEGGTATPPQNLNTGGMTP